MKINGNIVKDMYFTRSFVWSADSRYLAVQKWIELDPHNGPHTSIFLMDMKRDVWIEIAKTYKGLVNPVRINNEQIVFSKEYIAPGVTPYFEERKKIQEIKNWKKMEYFVPSKDSTEGSPDSKGAKYEEQTN